MTEEFILKKEAEENFPFLVKRQNDAVIIEAKVPEHLTKRQKQQFNSNKATVELALFDEDFVDRMNNMPYDTKEEDEPRYLLKTAMVKLFHILTIR